jgi:hypothetical protein
MIPIYIYCTKEKPYLLDEGEFGLFHRFQAVYDPDPDEAKDLYLNGRVVARCEANEAFGFKCIGHYYDTGKITYQCSKVINIDDFLKRSRVSIEDIINYAKGDDLFAIHLENVTPCDLGLSGLFYKDHFGAEPITKAPQSYCHAFRKVFIDKDIFENHPHSFPDGYYVNDMKNNSYFVMLPCYIFADHSTYCADILNGFKDLEIRKTAPKELERK